jgi:hypothetical protein
MMFGKTWSPATGKVIDSRVTGASVTEHGSSVRKEFVVEITPEGGEPYKAVVPEGNYSDFWAPKPGQSVKLEIEAKTSKVRFDKSDLGLSFKEHERKAAEGFNNSLGS